MEAGLDWCLGFPILSFKAGVRRNFFFFSSFLFFLARGRRVWNNGLEPRAGRAKGKAWLCFGFDFSIFFFSFSFSFHSPWEGLDNGLTSAWKVTGMAKGEIVNVTFFCNRVVLIFIITGLLKYTRKHLAQRLEKKKNNQKVKCLE